MPAISASDTTHPVAVDHPPVRTGVHDRLPTANSPEGTHWDLGAIAPRTHGGSSPLGTQPWARIRPPQQEHLQAGLQCQSGRLRWIHMGH